MLVDTLKADMVAAMKAGNSLKTMVLRMVLSEVNYAKIDVQRELTDEDVIGVLRREVKKRREAIDAYRAGGRTEQADTEQKELEMLQVYLPMQMSEEQIEAEVKKILEATPQREFGQVMKIAAPQFKGRAEGALVAQVVKKILG